MAFDYKKEYKEFYIPGGKPQIVEIPPMNYIAVRGEGNPNDENGAYKQAVGLLYALAYAIKMSPKAGYKIEGYFDYVVPPLEGFWWLAGADEIDFSHKEKYQWISVIRLPDFVSRKDFEWAVKEVERKKKMDCSKAEFMPVCEGLCLQVMHIGPYDDETATIALMDDFLEKNDYDKDITDERRHHEIYLSDPRRVAPERCKTVIRHPIRKREN